MFFAEYSLLAMFDTYPASKCTTQNMYTRICAGLVVIVSLTAAAEPTTTSTYQCCQLLSEQLPLPPPDCDLAPPLLQQPVPQCQPVG